MKTLQVFLYSLLALLAAAYSALSADVAVTPEKPSLLAPENNPGRVYADTFITLATPDYDSGDWGYGVGVGYQVNKYWAADVRVEHFGLDANGSVVQSIGAGVSARLPWKFLAPGVFARSSFDLEADAWHLNPGISLELGLHKNLKGLNLFSEVGMDSRFRDGSLTDTGWKIVGGLRWRF